MSVLLKLFRNFNGTSLVALQFMKSFERPLFSFHADPRNYDPLFILHVYMYTGNAMAGERALLDGLVDVNLQVPMSLDSPLSDAVTNSHAECVSMLIKYGADVNIANVVRGNELFLKKYILKASC